MSRLLRCQSGNPAVEFAFILPLFLLLLVGLIEVGSLLSETTAVEKGLRAGAMIAARADLPLGGTTITRIKNVAMYGNPEGTGDPRARGWTDPSTIDITPRAEPLPGGGTVTVFRLVAELPYVPVVPGFLDFVGGFTMKAVHDQGYIGN